MQKCLVLGDKDLLADPNKILSGFCEKEAFGHNEIPFYAAMEL